MNGITLIFILFVLCGAPVRAVEFRLLDKLTVKGGMEISTSATASPLIFASSTTNPGNVGIGTAAPGAKLQINSVDDSVAPVLSFRQGNAPAYGYDWDHDTLVNGDLSLMRVENSVRNQVLTVQRNTGNVGVGTTGPGTKLDITQTAETLANIKALVARNAINLNSLYGAGVNYAPGISWSATDNNPAISKAGIFARLTGSGSYLHFGTSNNYAAGITNDAMVIDYSGNVGIGLPGPGQKLSVAGTIESTTGGIKFPDATTQASAGSVLQTRIFSDYTRRSTASGGYYYFGGTEFSNAITPKKSDSIIVISINYFGEPDTHDVMTLLQYSIGGGAWTNFDVVGNGQQGTFKPTIYNDPDINSTPHNHSTQVAKAFGTTQAVAFRMYHFNGGTFTHNGSWSTTYETAPSTLILQELDAQNSSYVMR